MRKKIQLLMLFLLMNIVYNIQGQIKDFNYYYDYLPKSPTSYNIERFGSIQNSEYTGSNSPSIPLINIKDGDINIPLNLQYIAGNGVRARDEASNVGLGWVIGLPTISQTILGGYDDLNSYYKLKVSFMYDTTPPTQRNPLRLCENDVPINLQTVGRDKFTYFKTIKNMLPVDGKMKMFNSDFSEYDTSPDLFVCNLFGEKIYFVTSNFQTVSQMPYTFSPTFKSLNKKGYLISYDNQNKFKIIDPKGIQYYFSKFTEYGLSTNLSGRDFYLTSIMDKNNHVVNLSYDENTDVVNIPTYTQGLNYTSYLSVTTAYDFELTDGYTSGPIASCHFRVYKHDYFKFNPVPSYSPYYGNALTQPFVVPASLNTNLYQSKIFNIKQIEGNFGRLVFSNSNRIDYPSSKKLDEMTLFFKNNVIKNIKFNYSYFDSKNSITVKDRAQQLGVGFDYNKVTDDQLSKRLKLNSLLINNSDSYNFVYDETYLVNKDSFAVDYWGNFNGQTTNNSLFAKPTDFNVNIPINNDYNNNIKTSSLAHAKSGVLTKIIYPTKGYSTYEYELNSADNLFENTSSITQGQGLRLKKQSNYNNDALLIGSTVFDYEGGKSINPLDLFKDYSYKTVDKSGVYNVFSYQIKSTLANSDNNVSPLSSGNILGYSKVTKNEVDENGSTKGKIVTTYFNNRDVRKELMDDNIPVYIPTIKNNNFQDNGSIKEIEYYRNDGVLMQKDSLVYEDVFPESYEFYGSSLTLNHNIFYNRPEDYDSPLVATPISSFSYFPLYYKESRLISKTTKEYINSNSIETKENYNYDIYNLLSTKSTSLNNSINLHEQYSYSYNIPKLSNKNILSDIYKKSIYKNGKRIYERNLDYSTANSHFNPVAISETTLVGDTNTIQSFDRYDSYGNLMQHRMNDGIPNTIIWGYNNTQAIAKVVGSTYPDPNNPLPTDIPQDLVDSIVNASNSDAGEVPGNDESSFLTVLDGFRTDPRNANFQITTYTYDPLIGVRSITSPNGMREVYLYDAQGRLKEIRERDKSGSIIKEFNYNYASLKYFNSARSQTFTRNNCGANAIGSSYTYIVPKNKYSSYDSQQQADALAQAEINANGQNSANTNATCTPYVSCGFNPEGLIPASNFLVKSVILQDNVVDVKLTFRTLNINRDWSNSLYIGFIPGSCKPNSDKYLTVTNGSQTWEVKVQVSGQVTIKLIAGTVNTTTQEPPTYVNFEYTK